MEIKVDCVDNKMDENIEKIRLTLKKFNYLRDVSMQTLSYKKNIIMFYMLLLSILDVAITIILLNLVNDIHEKYVIAFGCIIIIATFICLCARTLFNLSATINEQGLMQVNTYDMSWPTMMNVTCTKKYNAYMKDQKINKMRELINGYYMYNITNDYVITDYSISCMSYIKTFILPMEHKSINQKKIYKGIYVID